MNVINLDKTGKKHLPALWERGGGYSNTGFATIVAGENGEILKPVYVKRRGHLANSDHALFVVKQGYIIVTADEHRGDVHIKAERIKKIVKDENGDYIAEAELIFDNNYDAYTKEWMEGVEPDEWLKPAVDAAVDKSRCYHCRCPHYALY